MFRYKLVGVVAEVWRTLVVMITLDWDLVWRDYNLLSHFCKTPVSFVLSLQILIAFCLNDVSHIITVFDHVSSISGFFRAEEWLRLISFFGGRAAHRIFSSWWELIRYAVSFVEATIRKHSLGELCLVPTAHLNRGKLWTESDTVAGHDAWSFTDILYGYGLIQGLISGVLLHYFSLAWADDLFFQTFKGIHTLQVFLHCTSDRGVSLLWLFFILILNAVSLLAVVAIVIFVFSFRLDFFLSSWLSIDRLFPAFFLLVN